MPWGWGIDLVTVARASECEDETGASWGPANHGMSFADGAAFFRAENIDLSGFAGTEGSETPYWLELHDSAGKEAAGFIGNQDAAETLGSELVTNGAFDNWTGDDADDWNEISGDTSEETSDPYGGSGSSCKFTMAAGNGLMYQEVPVTEGKLYKVEFAYKNAEGDAAAYGFRNQSAGVYIVPKTQLADSTSWSALQARYFTAPSGCSKVGLYFYGMAGGDVVYFDAVSCKEVTDVGATGVHIVDDEGGSTRDWDRIESGFNYNDDAYTFEVTGYSCP